MEQTISFQKSVFADLQTPEVGNDSDFVTPRFRDVHFLLNEKLLEGLDPASLKAYSDALASPTSSSDFQMTDDDLFALASSRYVQQPSDVSEYAKHLEEGAKDIIEKYQKDDERKAAWKAYIKEIKSRASHLDDNSSDGNSSD